MKKTYGIVLYVSIMLTACSQSRYVENSPYADESSNTISYQQFYDDLDPYGQWIDNPEFGRVWIPREQGFRPYYSNGRWAYTNYGWTWVSDYNWGWAPFHYGRWFYDKFYGWSWVPGYEWAPAWVNWRQNSNYYGWAPLCPRRRNGSYYEVQNDQWAFVPHQYINRNNLNNYYINPQNNITIINNTNLINKPRSFKNGTQYQEGPTVAEVEKVTNTKIRAVVVKQSPVPGETKLRDGALHIYRPKIQNAINKNDENKITPSKNLPVNTQGNGANSKAVNPDNNIIGKPIDRRLNNPATNDPNFQDAVTNPATNGDRAVNPLDRKRRQLQDYPPEQINTQQNPVNVRPNINRNRVRENQDDDINNNTQPQRILADPSQSPQRRIDRVERFRTNEQQNQNPNINRRPVETVPTNRSFERPSNSYERRPQIAPQTPPANLNRENNAGRKIRSF